MQVPLASHLAQGTQPAGASAHEAPMARRTAHVPCWQKSVATQPVSSPHESPARGTAQVPVAALQVVGHAHASPVAQAAPAGFGGTQTPFTQVRSGRQNWTSTQGGPLAPQ
jgi:hypothetical protein